MSEVQVKTVVTTTNTFVVTLSEEEGQALSDLLSSGVDYDALCSLGLNRLNSQLADFFPDTKMDFDVAAKA